MIRTSAKSFRNETNMPTGSLSSHFEAIAAKALSAVEASRAASNQHEFNGVNQLKKMLGPDRKTIPARFIYLDEKETDSVIDETVTWYDARERHPTRSEYRLYFRTNAVTSCMSEDDLLVVGKLPDGSILIVVAADDTVKNQIRWLFQLPEGDALNSFVVHEINGGAGRELNYARRIILSQLQIETTDTEDEYLELLSDKFGTRFPGTEDFAKFTLETLPDVPMIDDPDAALIALMDRNEMLFRTLEKHIVEPQISAGFDEVDKFIDFSQSVLNRRKSRAGYAFEHHVMQILGRNELTYSHSKATENNSKPDFIFPCIEDYHNRHFPGSWLTVLGTKNTCKDRWRQVLAECDRIEEKHLLTLEPGISEKQTREMKNRKLQLIVPNDLNPSYTDRQQSWLMNVSSFLQLVRERQRATQ